MKAPYGHPAWIEIDVQQFKQNIQIIRQRVGKSLICLPVKSNAYGHGLVPMAHAAVEAGVDYLAVSCLQEGASLRKTGIAVPILVLGAIHEAQIEELLAYDLECSVSSFFKAELIAKVCHRVQKRCKVHLEIDTGIHRTGVRPQTGIKLLEFLLKDPAFQVVGVYSHFATADMPDNDFVQIQINEFKECIDSYATKEGLIRSIANSGGVCYYPESYMDMVRPGLLAYGLYPSQHHEQPVGIKPVLSFKAKVSYFKVVGSGKGISYGHSYITDQESRIVTVPVGYGDGYRRGLSKQGCVLLDGRRYSIAGAVCMDQCMVDIKQGQAYVGDVVTLIGRDGNEEITLHEIAQLCDTIPYEVLAGLSSRMPRLYKDNELLVWDDIFLTTSSTQATSSMVYD